MFRYFNIRKIVELLELGFHFKCIRPREGEIEIYKDDGTFFVALDKYLIYASDYYVFSNSNESLEELIKQYNF